ARRASGLAEPGERPVVVAVVADAVAERRQRAARMPVVPEPEPAVSFALADEQERSAVGRPARRLVGPDGRRCVEHASRAVEADAPERPAAPAAPRIG